MSASRSSAVVDLTEDEDLLMDLSWLRGNTRSQPAPAAEAAHAHSGTAAAVQQQQLPAVRATIPSGRVKQDPSAPSASQAHAHAVLLARAQAEAQMREAAQTGASSAASAASAMPPPSSSASAAQQAQADQPHFRFQVELMDRKNMVTIDLDVLLHKAPEQQDYSLCRMVD